MLKQNIDGYKRKYYLNLIIKGSISAISIFLTIFYFVNILEYLGNFSTLPRAIFFYILILVLTASFYYWIFKPLYKLLNKQQQLSDQDAAFQIGKYFPQVRDKLLNALQLEGMEKNTDLIEASLQQRETGITGINFADAVDLKTNRKYLKYLTIPIVVIIVTVLIKPDFFLVSTPRIINYTEKYELKAPFNFIIQNNELKTFKNDDFELNLKLEGSALPQSVQIITSDGRKLKMTPKDESEFSFTFRKIQRPLSFNFEASGFDSESFNLSVLTRPSLRNFNVYLEYPTYINKQDERVENTGNLIVPEGTKINWQFKTLEANELVVGFNKSKKVKAKQIDENIFSFNKMAKEPGTYQVSLKNEHSNNKDIIEYYLNVIPDEYPSISIKQFEDTVMYDYLVVGGNIGDDYGITSLQLRYKISDINSQGEEEQYESIKLNFNPEAINQSFFYKLNINDLEIKQGEKLEYFVQVWDNDGVNGRKSSKTSLYQFKLPSKEEFKAELAKNSKETQDKIEGSLDKAKELNKDLEDLQNKLKGKKKLDWQDKKNIEKLLEKNNELKKEIENLQKQNKQFNKKKMRSLVLRIKS